MVDRLSKLPKDQQPFWLLNWQALEEQRKNPQTYPQRPSHFNQPLKPSSSGSLTPSNGNPSVTNGPGFSGGNQFSSGNSDNLNNNFGSTNSATANFGAPNIEPLKTNPVNVISNPTTSNSGFENRFGNDDTNFETTRVTPSPVLKPTYPIYAHVDDVLSNNYVPSRTSQSRSLRTSSNKPAEENLVTQNRQLELYDTRFTDTGFFYAPSLSMFRQPILYTSFSNYMAKPFDSTDF